jgi:hypothetical protein
MSPLNPNETKRWNAGRGADAIVDWRISFILAF